MINLFNRIAVFYQKKNTYDKENKLINQLNNISYNRSPNLDFKLIKSKNFQGSLLNKLKNESSDCFRKGNFISILNLNKQNILR